MRTVDTSHNIVEDFRNGNEAAVKQLYNLHYRALCYFAEQLVGDTLEAEDIAVESFLKLMHKKADFNSLATIQAYLYTVTRNACFDLLRKNKRREKNISELTYLAAPDPLFGEQEMITAQVLQVIYAAVENLPGQCKQVFKSIFIEGKNTATIAAEMGISPQTVLNQKTKAINSLRMVLYKEGLFATGILFYFLSLTGNGLQA